MSKVWRKVKSFFYALPFGMKAADSEIMGSTDIGDGVTINQEVTKKSVINDLLKGEVTQEVEELRYRTYEVNREADKYNYIGNGMAVKKEEKKKDEKKHVIKFSQENKLICTDILTELKRVNNFGTESYAVTLGYMGLPRIKFEQFLTSVDVLIDVDKNNAVTTLHFSSLTNPSVFASKPFVASLNALYEAFGKGDNRMVTMSDFNTLACMNFVTNNTVGEEVDVVSYSFLTGNLIDVDLSNAEYELKYEWDDYVRLDLTEKFYSKSMDEKYKNKESKGYTPSILPEVKTDNNTLICSKCGKEIDTVNGELPFADNGNIVCQSCYINSLLKNVNQ